MAFGVCYHDEWFGTQIERYSGEGKFARMERKADEEWMDWYTYLITISVKATTLARGCFWVLLSLARGSPRLSLEE